MALRTDHIICQILEVCYKSGVKVVTIYAFSIENFKRSKYEVDALMDMAKVKLSQLAQHGDILDRYGASIRILGQRELVKPDVLEAIDRAVELTSRNGDAILNVCFPYTSRDEITTAIRNTVIDYSRPIDNPPPPPRSRSPFSESHIVHSIRAQHLTTKAGSLLEPPPAPSSPSTSSTTSDTENYEPSSYSSVSSSTTLHPDSPPEHTIPPSEKQNPPSQPQSHTTYPDLETITPSTLSAHMFTAGTPPLDLLVRTSGVERLSDFMLWQCHQDTEIVFLECLWPEFDLWHFLPVLWEWQWRRRKGTENEGRSTKRRKKVSGRVGMVDARATAKAD